MNGIEDPNSISFNGGNMEEERPKRMALIASQGTLDWPIPLYFGINRSCDGNAGAVFFTFYGLTLLK